MSDLGFSVTTLLSTNPTRSYSQTIRISITPELQGTVSQNYSSDPIDANFWRPEDEEEGPRRSRGASLAHMLQAMCPLLEEDENAQKRIDNNIDTITLRPVDRVNFDLLDGKIEIDHLEEAFKYENIEKRMLGSGHYGFAYKASYGGVECAVKQPRRDRHEENYKSMVKEIKIMAYITSKHFHPNLLFYIAGDLGEENRKNICLLTELCDTSLFKWLSKAKTETFNNECFREIDLYNDFDQYRTVYMVEHNAGFGPKEVAFYSTTTFTALLYQIALGMLALSKIPCCHRDLATRNVLLLKSGNVLIAKIADFGLAKKLEDTHYSAAGLEGLPINIMSPSAREYRRFSVASDIWAYHQLIIAVFVFEGVQKKNSYEVLVQRCHHEIQDLLERGMLKNKKKRPTFEECVEVMRNHLQRLNPELLASIDAELQKLSQRRTHNILHTL
ncbi:unnamed protein product, partial [Mesorhabditis belari]|uniref:Protein kinase domain-containing protein n=1 Tax=Mesorhabditis belari TaxID=2138241 RepID=A0AAF3FQD2_9BILA